MQYVFKFVRCVKLWICGIITIYFLSGMVAGETCNTGKECKHGCCYEDPNNPCCSEPFWSWEKIIGVILGGVVFIVLLLVAILSCIYCKNKKTHGGRLRHTVSMRSNRIRPLPADTAHVNAPPGYYDIHSNPVAGPGPPMYEGPPPKYEDVVPLDVPRPQISVMGPTVARSAKLQGGTAV